MNFEQIEKRNKAIMDNAKRWANDEDCLPLYQLDVAILGEVLKIKIPKCFHHFHYSEGPTHIKTTGASKTIWKTLDKIRNKLKECKK